LETVLAAGAGSAVFLFSCAPQPEQNEAFGETALPQTSQY
jgi:hypothetical protein